MKKVAWFSAGVSSAVASKLSNPDHIIYIHIDDQHSDTMRFISDCEKWIGKKFEIMQSRYKSVNDACRGSSFISGPYGASCTRLLKKRVRQEWESDQTDPLVYIWGFDFTEKKRADRIVESMPEFEHEFPLIENKISKEEAHRILKASGIKRPVMYDIGYRNNNCVGCVKGGKGYWNQIRKDFPDVFKQRSEMERSIGATCLNGIYLDELDPTVGNASKEILDDCGIFCEIMKLRGTND